MDMKKILVSLWLLVSVVGFGQTAQEGCETWFEEGNAAYNEGNYEQALTSYGAIEALGMESALLYYNIGNTYYKMKEYPKAILYYEKALKLDPSDEDIRTNLAIANLAIVDKINPIPQSFINRWWNSLKSSFSADGWAWMSVVLFALLLLCLFAFLMSKRQGMRKLGFFVGIVMLIGLALSVIFAIEKRSDLQRQDEAIIMTPTVTAKSSPSTMSVDLFVLHEGTKVRILDAASDWRKIRLADGTVGWLPAEDMIAF